MLALGIILVLLAAAALLAVGLGGADQRAFVDLGLFGVETTTLGVFLMGALTVLALVVGVGLTRAGARRANQHRRQKKELNRLQGELQARGTAHDEATVVEQPGPPARESRGPVDPGHAEPGPEASGTADAGPADAGPADAGPGGPTGRQDDTGRPGAP